MGIHDPSDVRRQGYLAEMGIPVWVPRDTESCGRAPKCGVSNGGESKLRDESANECERPIEAWDGLSSEVAACTACSLHESRTQTVFGTGNRQAEWLVVGEAPGADEDREGEPFVGRAGRLLNAMLEAIGLSRDTVYIANILKCRPPRNRDPEPAEVASCEGFLARQVALLCPRVILAVGRIAAQNLLKTKVPIGRLRGEVHRLPGSTIPVVVTYHPAYLLRSPGEKAKAWSDLRLARRVMLGEGRSG